MSRRTEIEVGLTVLIALAVLLWGVTWLKEFSFQHRVKLWHVTFPQTGGLGASDEVQVNGIRKGSVQSMKLVGDHVIVDLALASDIALTTESKVAIRNVGLMGEKVIAVDLSSAGEPLSARDTIIGIYEKGVPEVMANLGETAETIALLSHQLRGLAESMDRRGDFTATLRNFRASSDELRKLLTDNRAALTTSIHNFSEASQTVKGLTTDREQKLKQAIDDFGSAAQKLDRLSSRLDSLRIVFQRVGNKVDRGDGTLGKLVNDDKLYDDLSQSVAELRGLLQDVKANPRKYFKFGVF